MASNVQRGPNRMDSSDWTRIKRLRGAVGNMAYVFAPISPAPPRVFENTINPAPMFTPGIGRYPEFGVSRIRRPASLYTDYVASQNTSYVLQTPINSCGENGAKTLTARAICNCNYPNPNVIKHTGPCSKCNR